MILTLICRFIFQSVLQEHILVPSQIDKPSGKENEVSTEPSSESSDTKVDSFVIKQLLGDVVPVSVFRIYFFVLTRLSGFDPQQSEFFFLVYFVSSTLKLTAS